MDSAVPTLHDAEAKSWDIVVRATHWLIVLGVLLNGLVTEEGSSWHVWIGYGMAAVLVLRLLWGMVGPSEARFSAFPPSPKRALQHLEDLASGTRVRHRSHNPLGAMMVYTIWATLLVIATTGILMANAETKSGDHYWAAPRQQEQYVEAARAPAADLDDDEEGGREEEEGPLVEVHEAAVNFLYVLIALHLAGVFFEVRRSGREIVIAMLPRRR